MASSFALQAFACTYGSPDESCYRDCYDPSLDCEPVFDTDQLSGMDSTLVGYRCADSDEIISIEEGEKRLQEYKEWLNRQRDS